MIYLLYGLEKFLIDKEIKKIIASNHIDEININTFDAIEDRFTDIIDDAQTMPMFDNKKIVVVDNAYFFTGANKKSLTDIEIDALIGYLEHPNPDTILIFNILYEKLDERKKIVKQIKKVATIKNFNQNNNINFIIKDMFGEYNINTNDINLLIDRVGKDLGILYQEIEKIKIYKEKDLNITKEDIINLTSVNIDIDIFSLVEKIINNDIEHSITIYHEMLKKSEEPIKILVILANQLRIIYQAKELYKKGYTGNDIASILGIHPYRIKLALEVSHNYNSQIILKRLSKLADLDFNIKSGKVDADLGLELFILGGNR